ncbi:BadF/BadG/BcrA/BcrD ATPase family protein [Paenibacillus beijingensis]|uniref:ATPase BadF/BadG/BcrA/BcrD type domain-containing protein n=1 Tax=Paenibacillus beijingensis TaxID=1126833 RepID=A0A0D5NKE0_9BACL|nr:BadF/BadG/BcrA/BcrD ATPase family protein [Paenibacillus beijingensis]AJY75477.1 hypothetical protein VN24_13980 [Paenibacillus beijingensis]
MQYVLGFDGGGTKTEVIAVDLQGRELLSLRGGASNQTAVTFGTAMLQLSKLLDEVPLDPLQCRGISLGLAGIYTEEEHNRVYGYLSDYFNSSGKRPVPLYVTGDAEIALAAGLGVNEGIIAIAGTGAIVYGFSPSGKRYRAGGWGHILGDKGSGYEIGLNTLQAVMLSFDGAEPPTALTEAVLTFSGIGSPAELRSIIYESHVTKRHIADYARLCIDAAAAGDAAAVRIIRGAAEDLVRLSAAVCGREEWFLRSRIAATGSIFTHSALFMDTFCEKMRELTPQISIVQSERKAAYGAALLALQKFV